MKMHSYLSTNLELETFHRKVFQLVGEPKRSGRRASIDHEVEELNSFLRNGKTTYPNNVTFFNFIDYLSLPTLVYELEYPRTDKYASNITI
jgi:sterol O-acyltransferase